MFDILPVPLFLYSPSCFFIALALPSTYVAITTSIRKCYPPLILSIAAQREGNFV